MGLDVYGTWCSLPVGFAGSLKASRAQLLCIMRDSQAQEQIQDYLLGNGFTHSYTVTPALVCCWIWSSDFFGILQIFCHVGLSSRPDAAGRRFEGAAADVVVGPIEFLFAQVVGSWRPLSPVTGRPFAAHQIIMAKQGSDAGFSLLIQQGGL